MYSFYEGGRSSTEVACLTSLGRWFEHSGGGGGGGGGGRGGTGHVSSLISPQRPLRLLDLV